MWEFKPPVFHMQRCVPLRLQKPHGSTSYKKIMILLLFASTLINVTEAVCPASQQQHHCPRASVTTQHNSSPPSGCDANLLLCAIGVCPLTPASRYWVSVCPTEALMLCTKRCPLGSLFACPRMVRLPINTERVQHQIHPIDNKIRHLLITYLSKSQCT